MNNGRVNIMGCNNADRFLLYERVAPKNQQIMIMHSLETSNPIELSKTFFR